MRNYEVNFIVDPVLSSDEIKSTAKTYYDMIGADASIVHKDEVGLRPLAYPIKTRTTGVYHCVEFECLKGDWITKMELAFRRDERIIRFLTVKLDKYGVKFNADKRAGLIGKKKSKSKEGDDAKKDAPKPAAKAKAKPAPAKAAAAAETIVPAKSTASAEEE